MPAKPKKTINKHEGQNLENHSASKHSACRHATAFSKVLIEMRNECHYEDRRQAAASGSLRCCNGHCPSGGPQYED